MSLTPTNSPENPRAVPGDNAAPDYAKEVTARMSREYAEKVQTLEALLEEARGAPKVINENNEALATGAIIKRLKDLDKQLEGNREVENEPFLRSTNAVNAFFFGWRDKIGRRNKNDRKSSPGATDILQARIDDFQARRLAEEQAKREAERQRLEREARQAEEFAAKQRAEAEEARAAAERARKPEIIEQKHEIADAAVETAVIADVQAETARQAAEDARIATLARPADMTRLRGTEEAGGGVLLTTAKEYYAMLVDRNKLDTVKLWPFFTDGEIEKALRQWAKTTGYRQAMDGAEIGEKRKGVTR